MAPSTALWVHKHRLAEGCADGLNAPAALGSIPNKNKQNKPQKRRNAPTGKSKPQRSTEKGARTSAPAVSYSHRQSTTSAIIHGNSQRFTVRHREPLGTVTGSIDFAWDEYPINPGLSHSFPWLAAIASRFESYRFNKLNFEFISRVPSSTSGAVSLMFDFDATDEGPYDLNEALSSAHAERDNAWKGILMKTYAVDRDVIRRRFVRNTEPFTEQKEARTSDVGNLFICTDGGTSDSVHWGEIWIEYEVELYTPQIQHAPEANMMTLAYAQLENLGDHSLGVTNRTVMQTKQMLGIPAEIIAGAMLAKQDFSGVLSIYQPLLSAMPGASVLHGSKMTGEAVPNGVCLHDVGVSGVNGFQSFIIQAFKGNLILPAWVNSAVHATAAMPGLATFIPMAMSALTGLAQAQGKTIAPLVYGARVPALMPAEMEDEAWEKASACSNATRRSRN